MRYKITLLSPIMQIFLRLIPHFPIASRCRHRSRAAVLMNFNARTRPWSVRNVISLYYKNYMET